MTRAPHDVLFQYAFGQEVHAAGLLREVLPAQLAASVDWSTLRLQPGTHVDKRLRRQHSDLLFSAVVHGQPALLYLLVEHKAKNDRWAVLQLLAYVVAIWKGLRASRPRPRRLPYIVPILVHQGRRPWSAPRELAALLAFDASAACAAVRPLQPAFQPIVVSIADWSTPRVRGMAITVFAKLVLEALQRLPGASIDEVVATVRGWRDLIREVAAAPTAAEALSAPWTYVLDTAPLPAERVIEVVDEVMEAENTMKRMTAGAWLRAEGRAEGKAEGIAEGLREAHARLLRRLLAERFGRVPRDRDRLIRAASLEQLERWAVRTLSAPTIDAVFE